MTTIGAEEETRSRDNQAWARWLARAIDNVILLPGLFIVLAALGFAAAIGRAPDFILEWAAHPVLSVVLSLGVTVILSFIWEPVFLSTAGATPGKWIMGIRVRDEAGKKLGFFSAFWRTFMVWLFGMGLGVPLLSLILMLVSRAKLVSDGKTSWDQVVHADVQHRRRPIVLWVVMIVLVFVVNIAAQALGRLPQD